MGRPLYTDWWFGTFGLLFHSVGNFNKIPTHELIFFGVGSTTNQKNVPIDTSFFVALSGYQYLCRKGFETSAAGHRSAGGGAAVPWQNMAWFCRTASCRWHSEGCYSSFLWGINISPTLREYGDVLRGTLGTCCGLKKSCTTLSKKNLIKSGSTSNHLVQDFAGPPTVSPINGLKWSKEVWKLNFRQYGEMKMQSRAAGAQRCRKSEERRCRCAKR